MILKDIILGSLQIVVGLYSIFCCKKNKIMIAVGIAILAFGLERLIFAFFPNY